MKHIQFVDLTRHDNEVKKEIDMAIGHVLTKTDFILGENVELFEKEFAIFCNTKFAVGVDSGSSALELGMRAIGIGKGDEVIVPVNTFIASAFAVSATGATPVLVDCRKDTYTFDINKVEKAVTKKTKAIMIVHLYGHIVDIGEIKKLSRKFAIPFIEDACQAHGAVYKNKKAGSFGMFAAFSFYPGKNLGAYGDGGMIVTNKKEIASKILLFRNYGQRKKYEHESMGWNKRLDTIQAAVLRVKLKKLDQWNKQRIAHARLYNKLLMNLPVVLPILPKKTEHIFHIYAIRASKRDKLATYLKNKGIATVIHYPTPIHLQKAYAHLRYKKGDFPVAEETALELLSLPMFPELTEKEIIFITKQIAQFYQ